MNVNLLPGARAAITLLLLCSTSACPDPGAWSRVSPSSILFSYELQNGDEGEIESEFIYERGLLTGIDAYKGVSPYLERTLEYDDQLRLDAMRTTMFIGDSLQWETEVDVSWDGARVARVDQTTHGTDGDPLFSQAIDFEHEGDRLVRANLVREGLGSSAFVERVLVERSHGENGDLKTSASSYEFEVPDAEEGSTVQMRASRESRFRDRAGELEITSEREYATYPHPDSGVEPEDRDSTRRTRIEVDDEGRVDRIGTAFVIDGEALRDVVHDFSYDDQGRITRVERLLSDEYPGPRRVTIDITYDGAQHHASAPIGLPLHTEGPDLVDLEGRLHREGHDGVFFVWTGDLLSPHAGPEMLENPALDPL